MGENSSLNSIAKSSDSCPKGNLQSVYRFYSIAIISSTLTSLLKTYRSLSSDAQENLVLFTDFDTSNQECNGLKIIKESGIKRAFLITPHTDAQNIQQELLELNAKLIPKTLKQFMPIVINTLSAEYSQQNPKLVDAVWLENDKMLASALSHDFVLAGKKIDIYRNPFEFMANNHVYPRNTPIFLDNNYEGIYISEIEFGLKSRDLGFPQLTLITGEMSIEHKDYPFFQELYTNKNLIVCSIIYSHSFFLIHSC